jgi:CHASE2 domain-containing sensor protein
MVESMRSVALYPIRGPTRERPLLYCWILFMIGFVVPVLPHVLVIGYLVAGPSGVVQQLGNGL